MPAHKERRTLPFSAAQMYDLVADIRRYPEFLPWVNGMRVRSETDYEAVADMIVGFKSLREQFTSRVVKQPKTRISVDYLDGPLRQLHNEWIFTDLPAEAGAGAGCTVDFSVAFAFKSRMFQAMAGQMFGRALIKMTQAFEQRAYAIYSPPESPPVVGSNNSSATSTA
jgi:coenzyme Q-binding protein COQ10